MITASKCACSSAAHAPATARAAAPVYPAKGESRITLDDLERYGARTHLPRRRRDAVRSSRSSMRGDDPRDACRSARRNFRRGQSLHRSAAPSRCRRGAPESQARALADACANSARRTNDVCHGGADRKLLDVLTCIRLKTTLEEAGRALWVNSRAPSEISRRDGRAVSRYCRTPSRRRARSPSAASSTSRDLGYRFPDYPLPPGETPDSYLRALTYAGARERWPARSTIARAVSSNTSSGSSRSCKLAGYFLIVWDIVQFCRENRIMAAGPRLGGQQRGLLRARNHRGRRGQDGTAVRALPFRGARRMARHRSRPAQRRPAREGHPVRLSALRRTRRRDDRERHHLSHAQRRARGRQGARLFRPSRSTGSRASTRSMSSATTMTISSRCCARAASMPTAPRITMMVDLVRRIQSVPRHLGQHSGGMVIAAQPLDEIVPLEPASMPGRVVVQWDKDDCADLGIIKIDLLGLGMLAVLEEAIPMIRAHEKRRDRPRTSAGRRSRRLRDATARRHHRRVPGREPRADGDAAAHEAEQVLRPGGRGRDHPARSHRRQHGSSVSRSPQRARSP